MTNRTDRNPDAVNILIVDDQKKNLIALEAILETLDVNLIRAQSGQAALDAMLENDFALVILDVQMPGMDGFETAKFIRGTKRTKDVPIIFVTAISKDEQYVFKGYESGAVDYLFKPIIPEILRSKTQVFVDLYTRNRELQRSNAELRTTREQLREQAKILQQSNEDLEHFAYVVSHDLKEPLRAVYSFLEIIEERYANNLDEEGQEMVRYAADGGKRMAHMIDSLLDYSKVSSLQLDFGQVDCNEVLNEVLLDLGVAVTEQKATITSDPLPTLQADRTQVKQLLQNLISNAIKFHGEQAPQVHVSAHRDNDNRNIFSVSDKGIGIERENHQKMFNVFQRLDTKRSYEGHGIGLAVCKTIVEKHGGEIWVDSHVGAGSTFSFTLGSPQKIKHVTTPSS